MENKEENVAIIVRSIIKVKATVLLRDQQWKKNKLRIKDEETNCSRTFKSLYVNKILTQPKHG